MDRRELTPRGRAKHVVHNRVAHGEHHYVGIELHAIELTAPSSKLDDFNAGQQRMFRDAAFSSKGITNRDDRW